MFAKKGLEMIMGMETALLNAQTSKFDKTGTVSVLQTIKLLIMESASPIALLVAT